MTKENPIMKVLINKKSADKFLWRGSGDFHCKAGKIEEKDLLTNTPILKNHLNKEFYQYPAQNADKIHKIKRGPQIITAKDVGYVIAKTFLSKNDIIVEAGSGSGSATSYFASLVKEVHSYDIKEDHIEIVRKNMEFLKFDNVSLKVGDLKDHIKNEKEFDLLFLDMPEPIEVIKEDISGLKLGKYICCYLPSIIQIQNLTDFLAEREDLYLEEITETTLREWRVKKTIARPQNRKEIDFTAFLVFIRKIA